MKVNCSCCCYAYMDTKQKCDYCAVHCHSVLINLNNGDCLKNHTGHHPKIYWETTEKCNMCDASIKKYYTNFQYQYQFCNYEKEK